MGLSLAERIMLEEFITSVKGLQNVVAHQGIQIAALISTLGAADAVAAYINPPTAEPAPESLDIASLDIAQPLVEAPIEIPPASVRAKPGPKPRLHGEMRTIAMGTTANV